VTELDEQEEGSRSGRIGREIASYFAKKKKKKIHCPCLNPHSVIIKTKVLADFWLIFLPIV